MKNKKQGAILLMVLGLTALMAIIALELLHKVREEVSITGFDKEKDDLRLYAYQGLEVTLAVFSEIHTLNKGLYSPSQGWGDPIAYAQGLNEGKEASDKSSKTDASGIFFPENVEIEITIQDESGKFPLESANEEILEQAFELLEVPGSESDILIDSLLDWIDKDNSQRLNGAEKRYYRTLEPPYEPRNALFSDPFELRYIQGFDEVFFSDSGTPTLLFSQFWKMFTLTPQTSLNLNTASELVLEVLSEEQGFDLEKIKQFLAGDDGIAGTEDDGIFSPDLTKDEIPLDQEGNPLNINTPSSSFRIEIETRSGNGNFILYAEIQNTSPESVNPRYSAVTITENLRYIYDTDNIPLQTDELNTLPDFTSE